jgi:hypothetical protein
MVRSGCLAGVLDCCHPYEPSAVGNIARKMKLLAYDGLVPEALLSLFIVLPWKSVLWLFQVFCKALDVCSSSIMTLDLLELAEGELLCLNGVKALKTSRGPRPFLYMYDGSVVGHVDLAAFWKEFHVSSIAPWTAGNQLCDWPQEAQSLVSVVRSRRLRQAGTRMKLVDHANDGWTGKKYRRDIKDGIMHFYHITVLVGKPIGNIEVAPRGRGAKLDARRHGRSIRSSSMSKSSSFIALWTRRYKWSSGN